MNHQGNGLRPFAERVFVRDKMLKLSSKLSQSCADSPPVGGHTFVFLAQFYPPFVGYTAALMVKYENGHPNYEISKPLSQSGRKFGVPGQRLTSQSQ